MKRNVVTKKIVKTLCADINPEIAEGWNDAQWTNAVLNSLCELGSGEFKCNVWTTGHPECANGGEWLYDQTWTFPKSGDWNNGWSIPMIAECEWGNLDKIREDFEKLPQARADLRVMIIDVDRWNYNANEVAQRLRDWARLFQGSKPNDLYLIVMYEKKPNAGAWNWRFFTIRCRRFGRPPKLKDITP